MFIKAIMLDLVHKHNLVFYLAQGKELYSFILNAFKDEIQQLVS